MPVPTLKTQAKEFPCISSAREHLEKRNSQYHLLPVAKLCLNKDGKISYSGSDPIKDLENLPVTDVALQQITKLMGIPQSYANRINPDLLAHSINEQAIRHDVLVTVMVESEKSEPDRKWITAILPSGRTGIKHEHILRHYEAWELNASVRLSNGSMDIYFGELEAVEVLPSDLMQVKGHLHNTQWGSTSVATRPSLEMGLYLHRLVCSNGAYAKRAVAEGKLMGWSTRQQVEQFLDRQIKRIDDFQGIVLRRAVEVMNETIPEDA
jgi:hypothetical protein